MALKIAQTLNDMHEYFQTVLLNVQKSSYPCSETQCKSTAIYYVSENHRQQFTEKIRPVTIHMWRFLDLNCHSEKLLTDSQSLEWGYKV